MPRVAKRNSRDVPQVSKHAGRRCRSIHPCPISREPRPTPANVSWRKFSIGENTRVENHGDAAKSLSGGKSATKATKTKPGVCEGEIVWAYGTVQNGTERYGTVWNGMERCGTVRKWSENGERSLGRRRVSSHNGQWPNSGFGLTALDSCVLDVWYFRWFSIVL